MNTTTKINKHKTDFKILLTADAVSSFGSSMTGIALILYIFSNTHSLFLTSLFPMISFIPKLIITPYVRKVKVNLCFKKLFFIGEILAGLTIANMIWTKNIFLILLLYCIYTIIFFFLESYRAEFLKKITDQQDIYIRQSISRSINIVIAILGPLMAGYILKNYTFAHIIYIDIATYLLAGIGILFIDGSLYPYIANNHDLNNTHTKSTKTSFLKRLISMKNEPIYIYSAIVIFIGGAASLLTLSYIIDFLKQTDFHFGIIKAVAAIGSLLGTMLINIKSIKTQAEKVSKVSLFLSGILLLLVYFKPNFCELTAILFLSGILSSLIVSYFAAELMMKYNNDELREKCAFFQLIVDGSQALSKPFAGFMDNVFGVIISLIVMGFVFITVSLVSLFKKKS